jgi:hypothetical protein
MLFFLRLVFVLLVVFFVPLSGIAQETAAAPEDLTPRAADGASGGGIPLGFFIRGSVLFFPEDNGNASAPMPILPALGGGAFYSINDLFAAEASLDLYGATYDYDYSLGRPVPANDEYRSAYVIGAVLGLQGVFRFKPMEDKFTVRAYAGPAFDLRFVLKASGIEDSEIHGTDPITGTVKTVGDARKDINAYYWSDGRFVFLVFGGGMDFPVFNAAQLGFDIRAWYPVWRLWTGETLPAIEGWRFGVGFRIAF